MNICAALGSLKRLQAIRRPLASFALLALLTACASPPPPPPPPAPAPVQPSLTELMKQAQDAQSQGSKERAREAWRDAAKAYPTSKEPWQKLAEDHFAAADYGYAVLAAQEVSQRDPADRTAHSILAVAGLRVAAMALGALRGQQSGMPADTRSEAEGLTKLLRETLGEQVLVPPTEVAAPAPRRATVRRAAAEPAKSADAKPAGAKPADAKPADAKPADAKAAPDAKLAELVKSAKAEPAKAEAAKPTAPPPKPAATPSAAANPFDRLR
ncbi:hypothetical protein [Inhella sp.]|uniref:hypothetical protein n=1 Tax=Inhella sp. TaxID=1921806 RepID=UPI0035B3274D